MTSDVPTALQLLEEERQRFEAAVAVYLGEKAQNLKKWRVAGNYPERPALDFAWTMWQVGVGLANPKLKDCDLIPLIYRTQIEELHEEDRPVELDDLDY